MKDIKLTHCPFTGKPFFEIPKCANCGKDKNNHKADGKNCPIGTAHRKIGYTQFSKEKIYSPKMPRKKIKEGLYWNEFNRFNVFLKDGHYFVKYLLILKVESKKEELIGTKDFEKITEDYYFQE